MTGSPRRWRRLAAVSLCAATFFLSGCVYLRLLALKHQLGDFNKNFGLRTTDGLRLTCFNPVLLSGDLRWLGILPEKTAKKGRDEQWWVHWVKESSGDATEAEPAAQDLELEINFTENKFSGFFIAERYFAFIPKSFFVGLLRGLGGASIDKDKRSVSAEIALSSNAAGGRPTAASLRSLLGTPTERNTSGGTTRLRYRYLPPTPGTANGDFDLLFIFDTVSGELVRMEGRSPVGQMLLNFQSSDAKSATNATKSPASAPAR
ncbi:MAG: hypothetical protein ABIZ81_13410 [Opitutaceae bacterium]